MEERLERDTILNRIHAAHRRMTHTLDQLTPVQQVQPDVVGFWSVKDVVAHLVFWNRFAIHEVGSAQAGNVYPHPEGTPDEINERAVAEFRHQDWRDVHSLFEQSCRQLIDMVENLADDAFMEGNAIEQILDETIHGALANNTYEHWPIHEAQIRMWMEEQE
ncbi:MAG: maleylpyruvate isomerase N-terminal domain-containing protein [Anaerolineae bacterium]